MRLALLVGSGRLSSGSLVISLGLCRKGVSLAEPPQAPSSVNSPSAHSALWRLLARRERGHDGLEHEGAAGIVLLAFHEPPAARKPEVGLVRREGAAASASC
jgi:hypothetical protein